MKYVLYFWGQEPQVAEDPDLKEWKDWLENNENKNETIGEEIDGEEMEEELRGYRIIKAD